MFGALIFLGIVAGLPDSRSPLLRSGVPLTLDQVLDDKNVTAVVVDAKTVSNNTIQVVFEANISSQSARSIVATSIPTKKTSIRIVYSAEEPNSRALLREGLIPLFTRPDILNVSNLELVPFGNAMEMKVSSLSTGFLYWHPELKRGNITNVYRCPNGEGECESSLIHGCAMDAAQQDPRIYLPFISCMASMNPGTPPEDSSFACSNSTSYMETLRNCALGPQGVRIQHELAAQASSAKSVPSIYVNGILHALNVTENVRSDLLKIVCDAVFAEGRMDRDACEGKEVDKKVVAPFESLLTAPTPGKQTIAAAK